MWSVEQVWNVESEEGMECGVWSRYGMWRVRKVWNVECGAGMECGVEQVWNVESEEGMECGVFAVPVTVHCRHSEGKEPTRCDKVCSFYCLNMFRAPICPSSGVQLVNIFHF
jgi:hypothetical protein